MNWRYTISDNSWSVASVLTIYCLASDGLDEVDSLSRLNSLIQSHWSGFFRGISVDSRYIRELIWGVRVDVFYFLICAKKKVISVLVHPVEVDFVYQDDVYGGRFL